MRMQSAKESSRSFFVHLRPNDVLEDNFDVVDTVGIVPLLSSPSPLLLSRVYAPAFIESIAVEAVARKYMYPLGEWRAEKKSSLPYSCRQPSHG